MKKIVKKTFFIVTLCIMNTFLVATFVAKISVIVTTFRLVRLASIWVGEEFLHDEGQFISLSANCFNAVSDSLWTVHSSMGTAPMER